MSTTQESSAEEGREAFAGAAPNLKAMVDMMRVEFDATLIEVCVPSIGLERRTKVAKWHDGFERQRVYPALTTAELRAQIVIENAEEKRQ